ncbi:S8 family serine peptidase [Paenibacillus sp. LK1]|uniref:S8 family serine peptidase n=1 Tax=Paenibacillus sp. LK1 TaxID=2053014 RepID=UPI000C198CD3|nr:S8 family serine peptidase [Paenibacillus sp. LK1]PIH55415.1 peptidase S8 [Paenibacillus sp. LK1]
MNNLKSSQLPNVIYAQASVVSIGGQSIFDESSKITSDSVQQYHSKDELVQKAVKKLKENGFEVLNVSDISISISASPKTFEKVFNTTIVLKEREVRGIPGKSSTTILDSTNSNTIGFINTDNSPLADVLEGIAIGERVFYYSPALMQTDRPSDLPPQKDYYHLNPPYDLVKLLRAGDVHQSGIKGNGIKVVMVDSGFYKHPFFSKHNFKENQVILGPGAVEPEHDESGHGTGESVNLFSLAPNVDFTMVKMNFFDSVGAFNAAVALNPDIITCSWGSDIRESYLSGYDKVLEAAVANAVSHGITVLFSSGNGQYSFPGMHPDVVSVGGVFVQENGIMQATQYASGFMSRVYPNRQSPDICGLVGLLPLAAYIMLPVEPGDEIDKDLSGNVHPNGDETSPNDGWAAFSGTSAAAPQIAGVCALMKQVNHELSPIQIREILQRTARDVTEGESFHNPALTGRDLATGYGLVDAYSAIEEAKLIQ